MRFGSVKQMLFIAIGFVLAEIIEPMFNIQAELVLGIGVALLVMPRVPRIVRNFGMGIVLASDLMQGWIQEAAGNFQTGSA